MSFLDKLLARKAAPTAGPADAPSPAPAPAGQAEEPATQAPIRAYDAYGREIFVPRDQWRDSVLAGAIERHWDDADALSGLIIQSLGDGFIDEMVKPADRLVELQPGAERGVVLQAIVYMKTGRLDDAERVLRDFMAARGETGIVLTNLAKIQDERGDEAGALATLWHALELDPNQDNGLGWYEAIHREHGGDAAGVAAMRKVAALPGSWRAQLWLAHGELGSHNLSGAIALYEESLARAGKDDLVVPDHRAAAQGREADRARRPCAGDAVAPGDALLCEVDGPPLRGCLAQQNGGTGRGVDLHAMMHLDDLDVPIGTECRCDLSDERGKQIDAEAHIAGADDRDALCRLGQRRQMRRLQPGGADDMQDAGVGREIGEGDGRLGRGEIEHGLGPRESGCWVPRHRHAQRRQTGQRTRIGSQSRRARALDRRDESTARRLIDRFDQHASHAPCGTDDDETHVTHGRLRNGFRPEAVV